jgi:hypothetical protein
MNPDDVLCEHCNKYPVLADDKCIICLDKANKEGKSITIDADFFGHLLDCMCNQKYLPTLDRPMSHREQDYQSTIDKAYQRARQIWLNSSAVTTNDA